MKKAYIKPIKPNFSFCVEFDDGSEVCEKDDDGLRKFLVTVKDLQYERISGKTDHCIPSPVGYWALLGFRPKDAVEFRNEKDVFFPILFS